MTTTDAAALNADQAIDLVDALIAAFPVSDWSDATVDLYVRRLERVAHPHRLVAVDRAITTLDNAPTIRWLLDTAHAEALRTGDYVAPVDPDVPLAAAAGVVARVRARLVEAGAEIDRRVPAGARGVGGHWHGGPAPCPVCGGVPGHSRAR